MPACESKLVSRSSTKATVAKTDRSPVLRVLGWALNRIRNIGLF